MNKRHKYFRNLRYKQRLEATHDSGGYNSGVYFITREPDPRDLRESNNFYLKFPDTDPAEWEKVKGRNYYRYWQRPEIPYSVVKHSWGRSGWKKVMKQQTARRNRRARIHEDDAARRDKSFYKKCEDRWHYD